MANPSPSTDIAAQLDTLFKLRVAIAEHDSACTAALLRHLPEDLQDLVVGILREYAELLEQRKAEEAALTQAIRTHVHTFGSAVRGTHLQATHSAGRYTWDTDGLLRYAETHPEVLAYGKQGAPFVTIRARTQRPAKAPLLYDMHTEGQG